MEIKYISARRIFWLAMMVVVYILIGIFCDSDIRALQYIMQVIKHSYLIGLAATWGTSIQRRIPNRRIRHYLLHIDGAISLWLTLRSLKFYVFESDVAVRILWYSYYIPLLCIAFFAFAISIYVGKSENYKAPAYLHTTFLITLLFIVGIMTNEVHGLAFYVDPVTGAEHYRILYYLTVAWILGLIAAAVYHVPKHREEGVKIKRYLMPYILIGTGLLYCILYVLPITKPYVRELEYTITLCTIIILFWEALIHGGFIQGNKDYEWCFKNSTIKAQIIDNRGNRIYQSHISRPLGEDDWYILSQNGRFKPDRNTEMLLARIRGGYVVWEKDIHDINYTMDNLLETRENIRSATAALQETIDEEIRHAKIREQNRLYDKVSAGVGPKFEVLAMCIRFAQTATGQDLKLLIRRIDIVGVYAKRKSNLLLLSEKSDTDFNMELELCFKETFDNLRQDRIDADFRVRLSDRLTFTDAALFYDLLQLTLEAALDNLKGVTAIASGDSTRHILTISMTLDDPSQYEIVAAHLHEKMEYDCEMYDETEDDSINISFIITGEGGTK